MSLPSVSPDLLNAGTNRFLSRFVPMLGISLSEMDYLRGWKDDFLGDQIADQYTAVSDVLGVGSGGALQFAHGGIYRLTGGAGVGAYHTLWLGNAADGYATLAAGSGWVMIARKTVLTITSQNARFGAGDSAGNNYIQGGYDTNISANWSLQSRTGGGAVNTVDSGIAADTSAHWHVLNVYPIAGGLSQVDYFLDGALIATTTVSVPVAVLTPRILTVSRAAAARSVDLDAWITIPRNLA